MLRSNAAVEAVGKDRLQAVADFDAIAMILDGEEQHDPLVLALLADAPLAIQRIGDVFDGVAVQRRDSHQIAICAPVICSTLAAIGFQPRARLRIENFREVADIALRLERFQIQGRERRGERTENQCSSRQFAEVA